MGEQHLYHVEAELEVGGERTAYPAFDYGLRTLELDTENKFAIVINGKTVFCKGANWIPADAIYARVDRERYETLIREAAAANFNMLRIWGGGRYEDEAFYRACDRHGIMVWHDFMFACAPYPDHLDAFRAEVEREADYQTQRLGRHACVPSATRTPCTCCCRPAPSLEMTTLTCFPGQSARCASNRQRRSTRHRSA